MKEIKLTQNKVAYVDDEDFDYLNQYKWYAQKSYNTFYAVRGDYSKGKPKQIRMHRVIMNVKESKMMIDHIDRNGLNNCKSNLRVCSNAENQWNTGLNARNKSGVKGVHFDKERNKWTAQIRHKGKVYFLGRYKDIKEAIKNYNNKAKELRGQFVN